MLGTLTPEQKKDWKSHVPALVHAYNCTRNAATGFSVTKSHFSTVIPYLEESTQPDQTQDSIFIKQSSQQLSNSVTHDTLPTSPPAPPVPRRSARSTKRAPPV